MTLEDAKNNIGKNVKYIPHIDCMHRKIEYGKITSVNDLYVFVQYMNDVNSKATRPIDLTLTP